MSVSTSFDVLREKITVQVGPPTFSGGEKQKPVLNQQFFAKLADEFYKPIYEKTEEAFFIYSPENGLWEIQNTSTMLERISDLMMRFADATGDTFVNTKRDAGTIRQILSFMKSDKCCGREDAFARTGEPFIHCGNGVITFPMQVVVLDNLSTLATNGHLDGQFEKVLALIHRLQADGIIVMLVHHENREGGFKGSGKIELVADQSLHLFSAGDGNTIKLLVRAEKIRMTSKAEQTAFRTEFDPESPAIIWPVFALKEEDRRRLDIDDPLGEVERNIGKKRKNNQLAWEYLDDDERAVAIIDDMLNGCLDDVIAADLTVRESVIADFKRQNHISMETLNQFLPDAKKTVEKTEKKSTPEKLAPVIWNSLKYNGDKNR